MKSFLDWLTESEKISGLGVANCALLAIVAIAIVTVVTAVLFLPASLRIAHALSDLTSRLRKLRGPLTSEQFHRDLEPLFQGPALQEAWREFRETLDVPDSQLQPAAMVNNFRQSESFMTREFIHDRLLNLTLCEAAPGILTALGLLGTFVSLYCALGSLQISDGKFLHLEQFINNLSGKFLCSICGVFAAIVVMIVERWIIGIIHSECLTVQHLLNGLVCHRTAEYYLKESEQQLQKLTDAFTAQTLKLEAMTQAVPAAVERGLQQAVGNTLADVHRTTNEILEAYRMAAQKKEESLSKLMAELVQRFREAMADAAGHELEEFRKTILESVRLAGEMNKSMDASTLHFNNTVAQLRQHVDIVVQSQKDMSAEIIANHKHNFTALLDAQEQSAMQMREAQIQSIHSLIDTIEADYQKSIGNSGKQMADVQTKLTAAIDKMVIQLNAQNDTFATELKTTVDYLLQGVGDWTKAASSQLNSLLSTSAGETEKLQQCGRLMTDSVSGFVALVEKVDKLSTRLVPATSDIQSAATSLTNSNSALRTASELVGEALIELKAVAERHQKTMSGIHSTLKTEVQVMSDIEQSLSQTVAELKTLRKETSSVAASGGHQVEPSTDSMPASTDSIPVRAGGELEQVLAAAIALADLPSFEAKEEVS